MRIRKCLAPFFVGQFEAGLDEHTDEFDVVLPLSLAGANSGGLDAIICVNQAIRDFVAETVAAGDAPVVLCGDCLSAIGCLAGLERCDVRPYYLLWFDAHGDFHTHETTISGHLGGMPLAMITGRGGQDILSRVGLAPIPDERVCHVGARDLEPGERESLQDSATRTRRAEASTNGHANQWREGIWLPVVDTFRTLIRATMLELVLPYAILRRLSRPPRPTCAPTRDLVARDQEVGDGRATTMRVALLSMSSGATRRA